MASAMLKVLVLIVCLNTFLYLGVNYALESGTDTDKNTFVQGDLFDVFLNDRSKLDTELKSYQGSLDGSNEYEAGFVLSPNSNFSNVPDQKAGTDTDPNQGGVSFLDGLKIVFAFIKTLWVIAFIPFYLFASNLLPLPAAIMIGLPLAIIEFTTLIIFLRGGGAS